MCIQKQLMLKRLPLPFEIISIIKDYSFYDIIISNTRNYKKKINYSIYYAISRNNNFSYKSKNNLEHWVFTPYGFKKDTIEFQAINCSICGNYKYSNNKNINKILCKCHTYNNEYF